MTEPTATVVVTDHDGNEQGRFKLTPVDLVSPEYIGQRVIDQLDRNTLDAMRNQLAIFDGMDPIDADELFIPLSEDI